jgi:hypothetical protein
MLVPSMNNSKIHAQIRQEHNKLKSTTVQRLIHEYDRERRKLKIQKDSPWYREYPVKTAGKNTWIVFMHKAPSKSTYKDANCINVLCIVYYYSDKGLKVYYLSNEDVLIGFNSHFFKRYNERLGLNLQKPLDIVKVYFRSGVYAPCKIIKKDKKQCIIGFCIDGLGLGVLKYNRRNLEWKTFISKDLTFREQDEMEQELIDELKVCY